MPGPEISLWKTRPSSARPAGTPYFQPQPTLRRGMAGYLHRLADTAVETFKCLKEVIVAKPAPLIVDPNAEATGATLANNRAAARRGLTHRPPSARVEFFSRTRAAASAKLFVNPSVPRANASS